MGRMVLALALIVMVASGVHAAETALGGGVFITHYAPSIAHSDDEPPEGWGDHYLATVDAIDQAANQNTLITTIGWSIWFVLAAWVENKVFCTAEFGLGDYSIEDYAIDSAGPCVPDGAPAPLESSTPGWPGPNAGTTVTATPPWSGNFVPIYYFAGYAYYEGAVPLAISPRDGGTASFTNCEAVPVTFTAACLGTMGLLTEETGVECHPVDVHVCCVWEACHLLTETVCVDELGGEWFPDWDSCDPSPCDTPVERISWGELKTMFGGCQH
ncbi:hypothetical protein ACFL6M_04095 [Candidatus Eisenbacteria bacterium]|uniref:Uncharacterized protein n=1 Tax=Eiseniibacteriota bacterium TaxID=2212470 RepID=A0ABV6YK96_UNCEI